MPKKSTKFSVALSQTAKSKRKGGARSKLDTVRVLLGSAEWQLFREALVNTDIPVQAIQESPCHHWHQSLYPNSLSLAQRRTCLQQARLGAGRP